MGKSIVYHNNYGLFHSVITPFTSFMNTVLPFRDEMSSNVY